jgi:DNA-binding IclR family transcriptional regulator
MGSRLETPRDPASIAAEALNALSRAPRMAMLRSLRGGSRRIPSEIYETAGLSAQEGLPHLLALQELGVIREDQGSFSLDVEVLNRMLQQTPPTSTIGMAPGQGL